MSKEYSAKRRRAVCFTLAAAVAAGAAALIVFRADRPLIMLLSFILTSVFIYLGNAAVYEFSERKEELMRRTFIPIYALYLALLVYFTLLDSNFGRFSPGGEPMTLGEYFKVKGNLVPFKMIYRQTKALFIGTYQAKYYVANILGNFAAFAPNALFLPVIFKRCGKFPVFFAATTALILTVETLQLIARVGSFDVDDYILNIIGASVLFAILSSKAGRRIVNALLTPKRLNDKE